MIFDKLGYLKEKGRERQRDRVGKGVCEREREGDREIILTKSNIERNRLSNSNFQFVILT